MARRLALGLCLAAVATAVSIWLQGFRFGVSNNAFHIPLVLGWMEQPGFETDAYYQTLSRFVSGVWWAIGMVATDENVEHVFLAAHVVSRFLALLTILHLLGRLGLGTAARYACFVFLTVAPVLYGHSQPADHGLFIDYFTHTEVTWPLVIVALLAGVQHRWLMAGAAAGICALLNLFVAAWMIVLLAALIVRAAPAPFSGAWLTGVGRNLALTMSAFTAAGAPVLIWTAWAVTTAESSSFSFRDYARFYFPAHFLIEVAAPRAVLNGVALWLAAVVLCGQMGWLAWRYVLYVLMGIFVAGVVLPYVADVRLLFNLHLLRVDGVVRFVSGILAAAAAVSILTGARHSDERDLAGAVMLLGLLVDDFVPAAVTLLCLRYLRAPLVRVGAGVLAALALIATGWIAPEPVQGWGGNATWAFGAAGLIMAGGQTAAARTWLSGAALTALAILMAVMQQQLGMGGTTLGFVLLLVAAVGIRATSGAGLSPTLRLSHQSVIIVLLLVVSAMTAVARVRNAPPASSVSQKERDWVEMASWVRAHPRPTAILIPVDPADDVAHYNFSLWAKTPVWVDRKQGAAVMWSPSFHETWRRRHQEVASLDSPAAFADYARQHGIERYLAPIRETLPTECPEPYRVEKTNDTYVLCGT